MLTWQETDVEDIRHAERSSCWLSARQGGLGGDGVSGALHYGSSMTARRRCPMDEESVNLGVRNNNGKEGRSSYPSVSMVLVLPASLYFFTMSLQCDWAWLLCHVFWLPGNACLCAVSCNASVYVILLTGQPSCTAGHVTVLVTLTNVRHHALF